MRKDRGQAGAAADLTLRGVVALSCLALAAGTARADQYTLTSSTGAGPALDLTTAGVGVQGFVGTRSRFGLTDFLSTDQMVVLQWGNANPNLLFCAGAGTEDQVSNHLRLNLAAGLALEVPFHGDRSVLGGFYLSLGGRRYLAWGLGVGFDLQATYLRAGLSGPGHVDLLPIVSVFNEFP